MSVVKISDLKIGQEFETDIKFNNGAVLFKAAEKISPKHIKALKAWGFTEVSVVEVQSATQGRTGKSSSLTNDSAITHIFSKTNNEDSVIIELKRIAHNLKDSQ